jgi:hypothetical protein
VSSDNVSDITRAPLEIFVEAAPENAPHRRRRRGRQYLPVGLLVEDRAERLADRCASEHGTAGEHLIKHATERPHVGAPGDRLSAYLFGAHVGGRANDRAFTGVPGLGGRRNWCAIVSIGLVRREPEIEHFDAAARRHRHVCRLEIPMDDALLVRGIERIGDLAGDVQCHVERQPGARARPRRCACLPDPLGQRLSVHQLHDEAGHALRAAARGELFEPVDRGNVRVVQRCQEPRLALETRDAAGVRREGRR